VKIRPFYEATFLAGLRKAGCRTNARHLAATLGAPMRRSAVGERLQWRHWPGRPAHHPARRFALFSGPAPNAETAVIPLSPFESPKLDPPFPRCW